MSVVEFAYTKYRNMMVPMIPAKQKGLASGLNFGHLLIRALPIQFLPLEKPKALE